MNTSTLEKMHKMKLYGNNLLIELAIKSGSLIKGREYTLDLDVTLIETEVKDSKMTYKHHRGYAPMVGMIGGITVYVSMRNGNCNAHFEKKKCLEDCISLLARHGIKISRVRIDGAGYKRDVIDYLDSRGIKFVIGANRRDRVFRVATSGKWRKEKLNTHRSTWNMEVSSVDFNFMKSEKNYRMVSTKIKAKDLPKEERKYATNGYKYKFIITNDYDTSEVKLVEEYNIRGDIEKNFDKLKNDFGWKIMPFSNMNENLVYLFMTAIAANLYRALIKFFSKHLPTKLKDTYRLLKFRKIFMMCVFTITSPILDDYSGLQIFGNKNKINYMKFLKSPPREDPNILDG